MDPYTTNILKEIGLYANIRYVLELKKLYFIKNPNKPIEFILDGSKTITYIAIVSVYFGILLVFTFKYMSLF